MNLRKTNRYRFPADWDGGTLVPAHPDHPALAEQARAVIARDHATLDDAEAEKCEHALEMLCDTVAFAAGLGDDTIVFFNPATGQWWAFPVTPAGPSC